MSARRFVLICLAMVIAVVGAGCVGAPDRYTITEKTDRESHTGRWGDDEMDVSVSGPISYRPQGSPP